MVRCMLSNSLILIVILARTNTIKKNVLDRSCSSTIDWTDCDNENGCEMMPQSLTISSMEGKSFGLTSLSFKENDPFKPIEGVKILIIEERKSWIRMDHYKMTMLPQLEAIHMQRSWNNQVMLQTKLADVELISKPKRVSWSCWVKLLSVLLKIWICHIICKRYLMLKITSLSILHHLGEIFVC